MELGKIREASVCLWSAQKVELAPFGLSKQTNVFQDELGKGDATTATLSTWPNHLNSFGPGS